MRQNMKERQLKPKNIKILKLQIKMNTIYTRPKQLNTCVCVCVCCAHGILEKIYFVAICDFCHLIGVLLMRADVASSSHFRMVICVVLLQMFYQ